MANKSTTPKDLHFCHKTGKVEETPMCESCLKRAQSKMLSFHHRVAAAAKSLGLTQLEAEALEVAKRCETK